LGIKAAYPMEPSRPFICSVSVIARPHYSYQTFRRKSITDLVLPLFELPYDIHVWGKDWESIEEHYGRKPNLNMLKGQLSYHHTPKVYSSSKINISLQSVDDQISNRTYDILTSGGFLLTSDTPGIRELLKPGVHCEVSSSPEETKEKIAYYLKHDGKRVKIAKKGYEYARDRFAYKTHLPSIFNQLELAIANHRRQDHSIYTVKKGDTLWRISRRYSISVDELKSMNGMTSKTIEIGQVLKVRH
jgi:spore maturation protein CgeB